MRILALLALAVTLGAVNARGTTRAIDPAKSRAFFSVSHVFVEHADGTVPIVSGTVALPEGSTTPASIDAVLDPTKIKTGEDDRDGVLQTSDWFDTAKYPTWTFASTKISPGSGGAFDVDGNLTIHGVTQPEQLSVTTGGTTEHPTYHATCRIDRHAFGMKTTRLDPAIGGTVDVTLDIALK